MGNIAVLVLVINAILLIWNLIVYRKTNQNDIAGYHELNAKLNYITATGSAFIILATYLGFSNVQNIDENTNKKVKDFFVTQSIKIDSIIDSKDVLKAGVYIVNNIEYKEDKEYEFGSLRTIDNKPLPKFSFPPKLIINTSTGENLRIKKVTTHSFVLGQAITKAQVIALDQDNKDYPQSVKFDVWIADYKTQ
jgi:hypothetical protein